MTNLLKETCEDCKEVRGHLMANEIEELMPQIPGWEFEGYHHLAKTFHFKNFKESMAFSNNVAELAEKEAHHPSLFVTYSSVRVTLYTHTLDGVTQNDFIMAAKIDQLLK